MTAINLSNGTITDPNAFKKVRFQSPLVCSESGDNFNDLLDLETWLNMEANEYLGFEFSLNKDLDLNFSDLDIEIEVKVIDYNTAVYSFGGVEVFKFSLDKHDAYHIYLDMYQNIEASQYEINSIIRDVENDIMAESISDREERCYY